MKEEKKPGKTQTESKPNGDSCILKHFFSLSYFGFSSESNEYVNADRALAFAYTYKYIFTF